MSMRINFGTIFDDGRRGIAVAAEDLAAAERQISSGRRIAVPSDDPIGSSTAIAAHAVILRMDAYRTAADAVSSRLSIADSVMSDVVNQLSAAQTTALSARGSTMTQVQRDAAANELMAIRDALLSDANTEFQGSYLFSGSRTTTPPFAQTGSGISAYQGDTSPTAIDIGSGRTAALSFDGSAIFQGSDAQHVLGALTNLASAVSSGDDAAIGQGIDALKRAFDRATAAQARIGTDLRAIDESRTQVTAARSEATERASKVEDADLVDAATRLSQAQTSYRAALGAFATIGRESLMDYLK